MVERARAARDAGLDSLFVGDHHSTGPGAYYQNIPIMGRLLAEWGDRPAGVLCLLPLWHPVTVAEHIGTLASLASGRFVLQAAIGGGAGQFAAMGVPLRGRTARFEAGLDIVRRLLAGETVSDPDGLSGVPFADASVAPVPTEPVEVWIGGTAVPAIDRAARLGDGWLANADIVPGEARSQVDTYLDACTRYGRTPTAVAIRRDVHVGRDLRAAVAVAEPVVSSGYRGFRPDAFAWGSPEQVAEQFRALAAMGYTDVIVRQMAPDQGDALASIALLAEVKALVADA